MSTELNSEAQLTRRCRSLNRKPVNRDGRFVVCWVRVNLRGENNPVIDAAVAMANSLALPALVLQLLDDRQPFSSDRLLTFQVQASTSLERSLASREITFIRSFGAGALSTDSALQALLPEAAALFLDEVSVGEGRRMATAVATASPVLVIAVDGQRLVPELALGRTLATTPAFRAEFNARREYWVDERFDIEPTQFVGDLDVVASLHTPVEDHQTTIGLTVNARQIDHSVPPVTWCHGAREHALTQLAWAACEVIPNYASDRNNPAIQGVTCLSPYLHYGVLCPHDIGKIVLEMDSSRDTWKFMDECFIWREFYHHLARNSEDPTRYGTIPKWARDTLEKHTDDHREELYTLEELIHGETSDCIWNAAQRQFLVDGYMHNNLRMYWGKQIIRWTPDPATAWYITCYLNDRFSLDGQDPATYGSIRWCFGGGRPAKEIPVYGTVSRKSDGALRRRSGVDAWLTESAQRSIPRVSVPVTGFSAVIAYAEDALDTRGSRDRS